jgi:hypothetical protein
MELPRLGLFQLTGMKQRKRKQELCTFSLIPTLRMEKCSFTHNYTRTAEIRYIFAKIQVTCTKCLSSYTQTEKVAASNENEYNKTEGKNDTHTHINISWVIFWFRRW